ncbi:hypothetical protein AGMMS49975_03710 [Clostridia bacterium]|nr:hypothetical protein AGMMS49975_03710 [Clostridia bacterium]
MQKQRKATRGAVLGVLIILFFSLAAFVMSTLHLTPQTADYTTFSTNDKGASVIYDTLRKIYDTSINYQKLQDTKQNNNLQIVIEPFGDYTSDNDYEQIYEFAKNGGNVICFYEEHRVENELLKRVYGAEVVDTIGETEILRYGGGLIAFAPAADVLNINLAGGRRSAGRLVDKMAEETGTGYIKINEAYHGYLVEPNIWDVTPQNIKNAAYQICIVVLLVVIRFGKRFGRAVPYYEEIERQENEYLLALANIYNRAGNGYVVFETDLSRFLAYAARHLSVSVASPAAAEYKAMLREILNKWEERGIDGKESLIELLSFKDKDFNTKNRAGKTRLHYAQQNIQKLYRNLDYKERYI